MAPIPWTASGRMVIAIGVSSLLHRIHIACSASLIGGDYLLFDRLAGAYSLDPQDAADNFWNYAKPFYNTGVVAPAWELQSFDGAGFIPVASGSATGGGGGSSSAPFLCSQLTFTFKDVDNHRVNLALMETSVAPPVKNAYSAYDTASKAFADDLIVEPSSGVHMWNWVLSRNSKHVLRALNRTGSLNHRIRRERHLA